MALVRCRYYDETIGLEAKVTVDGKFGPKEIEAALNNIGYDGRYALVCLSLRYGDATLIRLEHGTPDEVLALLTLTL